MRAACFIVVLLVHSTIADHYVLINEGYTKDSEAVLGQQTGVAAFDRLLGRLPGTARISGEHILEGPLYIQVPRADGHLAVYYADQGLGSVMSEPLLSPIRDVLLQDESESRIQALVYRPSTYKDPRLLNLNARELYIPDDFKVGDMLAVLVRNLQIPTLLIAEEEYFKNLKLDQADIKYIGKVLVSLEDRAKFIKL